MKELGYTMLAFLILMTLLFTVVMGQSNNITGAMGY